MGAASCNPETVCQVLTLIKADSRFPEVHPRCPARISNFPIGDSSLHLGDGRFVSNARWLICPGVVDHLVGLLPSCYDCNNIDFKSLPQIRR